MQITFIIRKYLYKLKEPHERLPYGPGTKYPIVNIPAILAFPIGGYVGSKLPGIPAINSIILAIVIYIVAVFICEKAGIQYRVGKMVESETGF